MSTTKNKIWSYKGVPTYRFFLKILQMYYFSVLFSPKMNIVFHLRDYGHLNSKQYTYNSFRCHNCITSIFSYFQ